LGRFAPELHGVKVDVDLVTSNKPLVNSSMPNFTLINAVCHPHRATNLKIASLTDLNTADSASHNPGGYWNESEFLEECKSVFITSA